MTLKSGLSPSSAASTIVNDGDGAEAVAVREWIDEHVSDENGMMPAQETPTACPGHESGAHRREEAT